MDVIATVLKSCPMFIFLKPFFSHVDTGNILKASKLQVEKFIQLIADNCAFFLVCVNRGIKKKLN